MSEPRTIVLEDRMALTRDELRAIKQHYVSNPNVKRIDAAQIFHGPYLGPESVKEHRAAFCEEKLDLLLDGHLSLTRDQYVKFIELMNFAKVCEKDVMPRVTELEDFIQVQSETVWSLQDKQLVVHFVPWCRSVSYI